MFDQRNVRLTTPLGPEALAFRRLDGYEALGHVGQYTLVALSRRADLPLDKLVGQAITITADVSMMAKRHLNLYVCEMSLKGKEGEYYVYEAILRPWLWFLTRTVDSRIFQSQSTPDIIKAVFADHPIASFESRLTRAYPPREYCVQYRESDYNFIARLCEQEGIYFWFQHKDGQHTLVLGDALSAHAPAPGYERIPFEQGGGDGGMTSDREHLEHWNFTKTVQPVDYVLTDYDFQKPKADLSVRSRVAREHGEARHEVFDYPGEYVDPAVGEHYVRVHLDAMQAKQETVRGEGNVRGLPVGSLFTLFDHPRGDQNREYMVTLAHLTWSEASYQSGSGEFISLCQMEALPSALPFRPSRVTPRPFVQGPQTAVVVGPKGEEIYCDDYGRVKVQFHWDRRGERDQLSSCWVRSSQPWAGQNFGAMAVPRIGQEVVVSFLEGDPDQPLITGRVYNASQMPPWELPANKTQSGMLSRSTPEGQYDHANALRFEDKKGEEELWLHAEKNQRIEVENDESHWVGHDRSKTVDNDETVHIKHDRTETVDNDETITIHNNRTERVDHDEKISIGDNRTEDVGKNETIDIGDNRKVTVGNNETINIGNNKTDDISSNWSISVGSAKTETVTLASVENVGLAKMTNVGAAYSLNVGAFMNTLVAAWQKEEVGQSKTVTVGKTLTFQAGDRIELVCGKSQIVMESNGHITISGASFDFGASGPVQITGNDIDLN